MHKFLPHLAHLTLMDGPEVKYAMTTCQCHRLEPIVLSSIFPAFGQFGMTYHLRNSRTHTYAPVYTPTHNSTHKRTPTLRNAHTSTHTQAQMPKGHRMRNMP